jgi:hypothetical protein
MESWRCQQLFFNISQYLKMVTFLSQSPFRGGAQVAVGIIYDFGNLYCLFHRNLFCHHIKSIAWIYGVVNSKNPRESVSF